ncbi:MAG: sigma-70 family RNA polymerase sigma factor [Bacteroidales bacterium]|nr:sigma-70 family RNA polymerase sigma factor [Bacteroidales bacterium]
MTSEVFKERISSLSSGLYRIAYRFLEDDAEAKDAVQDLLIKLWNQRGHLDVISNLQAYSFTLIKNLCIDRIRKRSKQVNGYMPEKIDEPPENSVYSRETLRRTLMLMEQLPPKQKEILRLRVFENLEYEEIANRMGLSQINARVQLSIARKTLKQKLQEYERV